MKQLLLLVFLVACHKQQLTPPPAPLRPTPEPKPPEA